MLHSRQKAGELVIPTCLVLVNFISKTVNFVYEEVMAYEGISKYINLKVTVA
jgi:hypothetical protein